jgi:antitoxin ParD1/3/4
VKPPLPAEHTSIATATERWLREEVVPVYDAMEADPTRGIPAEQVLAALRAHRARRIIERKARSG